MNLQLKGHIEAVDWISPFEIRGRVTELVGLLIRANVPGARVGEVCLKPNRRKSQVYKFNRKKTAADRKQQFFLLFVTTELPFFAQFISNCRVMRPV